MFAAVGGYSTQPNVNQSNCPNFAKTKYLDEYQEEGKPIDHLHEKTTRFYLFFFYFYLDILT